MSTLQSPVHITALGVYSAFGHSAFDVFTQIETRLQEPTLSVESVTLKNGESTNYYQLKISELGEDRTIKRIDSILMGLLNSTDLLQKPVQILWIQLPMADCIRAQWLSAKLLENLIRSNKAWVKLTLKFSSSLYALTEACDYLLQDPKLTDILFLSVDSLLDEKTVQKRANQHSLFSKNYQHGAALSEAGVCLRLSKSSENALLTLHHQCTDFAQLPESTWQHCRHLVSLLPQNNDSAELNYQLSKQYCKGTFTERYQSTGTSLLPLLNYLGDVGTANIAMSLVYLIGASYFFKQKNHSIIYQKFNDKINIIETGDLS